MQSRWRWMLAGLALAATVPVVAQQNLLKNPGFEEPAGSNVVPGWISATHGQDFVRCSIDEQSYHAGLRGAAIHIKETPRIYAAWAQAVRIEREEDVPDEVSLWYSAPDAGFSLLVAPVAVENGQRVARSTQVIALEKSSDWHQAVARLDLTPDVREVRLEVRASAQGSFYFDDAALTRREPAAGGPPDQLVLVGTAECVGLTPGGRLAPLWEERLRSAGWPKYSIVDWNALTGGLLRRARLVVLATPPRRPEVRPADQAVLDLLVEYVEAGGGLLLCQATAQQTFQEKLLADALARRFGTRMLVEDVKVDRGATQTLGAWGDPLAFTDRVTGPVKEGVKGVYYPVNSAFLCLHSVLPFLAEAPWQVVLAAGPEIKSKPVQVGIDDFDREKRAEGFDDNLPLLGIREYGQGRVGFLSIYAPQIFMRGHNPGWDREVFEAFMTKGIGERPSDLMTLLLNTFQWLSDHSGKLANATLQRREVPDERTLAWKTFRGAIGARTVYSSGSSTPDEYVTKARAMGLDYLIFLEDMAALHPVGFQNLKEDCRRLSDKDFLAIPGVAYVNTDGNHQYVYGPALRLPSELLLDRTGKKMRVLVPGFGSSGTYVEIHWLYTLMGFENNGGWYNFPRNPYPNYDVRDLANMGVLAQEGVKIMDRELGGYGLNNRNGQMLLPQAVTLLKSAAELEGCTNGTLFLNVIGAEGMKQLEPYLTGHAGRGGSHLYPGQPPYGHTYISTGPHIELTMPRADVDAQGDLYNGNLQEWPLTLQVTAAAGLKEVLLMDGDRVIRRFLPGGAKMFCSTNNIAKERQKYIWVHARDRHDGEAIGRAINCNSWILRENQCADRNNQLMDSRQKRPDGSPFLVGFGGGTATPDKGPWNGRIMPVGSFVSDEKLGAPPSIYDGSPENHPGCAWAPSVAYDGRVPPAFGWLRHLVAGHEGAPHVKPYRVVASSEVLVGDRVLDGVFPLGSNPVVHVWHSVYPVTPSTFLKTTARTTHYLIEPDGISAYLWEQDYEFLKDIPVPTNSPDFLRIGSFGYGGTAKTCIYARSGQALDTAPVKAVPLRRLPFDAGDYAGFLDSPFGSLAVYSLTDEMVLQSDNANASVYVCATGGVVKAGTKYRVRLLCVGIHREVREPAALAAAIRAQYGLGVPATGYTVQTAHGAVSGQSYVLQLAAGKDVCFRGTVSGLTNMAGNLGCQVTGLNDRWSALFQWQGKTPRQRLIPVEEGTGYAVLRDDDDGVPIFVGHPFVADSPEVVLQLALSKDWKRWELEIHNPTGRAIRTRVRSAPGLSGFEFNESVRLRPGASLFRSLDAAPR
ncbi:MAG: hypothetical protein PHR35_10735 [Kiritimatiellae bacterium]|nr:hypothetical protein [Kiritimatiellia bacterium]